MFSNGEWFSSHAEDPGVYIDGTPKPNGTRFKTVTPEPGKWVYAPLFVPTQQETYLRAHAQTLLGNPKLHKDDGQYDFSGVGRFVIPFIHQHPWKWFCSEAVVQVIQRCGLMVGYDAWRLAPNDLLDHFDFVT